MTDTKEQLQSERDQLAARSNDLALQLSEIPQDQGNDQLNSLAGRSYGQAERHKHAVDDLISVIDLRLQLLFVTAEVEASLQEQPPVE